MAYAVNDNAETGRGVTQKDVRTFHIDARRKYLLIIIILLGNLQKRGASEMQRLLNQPSQKLEYWDGINIIL